jgi:hypothetical protein
MIGIFPAIEGEICGNGVAVIGSGSTATCDNSQNASTGGNGGNSNLVDVSPAAQADACGNGVGVIGSGSAATCGGSQAIDDPGTTPGGENPGGTTPGGPVGDALDVEATSVQNATSPAANATQSSPGVASLAFTGSTTLMIGLVGLALAVIGTVLLRLRRVGQHS